MSTLFAFGCSFTQGFEDIMVTTLGEPSFVPNEIEYIRDYCNNEIPKSWPELLANKLGYDSKNCGIGGGSNYDIFARFCRECENIKKDDIVIIGWTFFMRFRWPNKHSQSWSPMFTSYHSVDQEVITKNTFEEIVVNRDNQAVVNEIYDYQKLIIRLSEAIGFKVFFWSSCSKIITTLDSESKKNKIYIFGDKIDNKTTVYDYLQMNGAMSISDETNLKIMNGHMSKSGHIKQSDMFYHHIVNNI
jgi:hypothetical protein